MIGCRLTAAPCLRCRLIVTNHLPDKAPKHAKQKNALLQITKCAGVFCDFWSTRPPTHLSHITCLHITTHNTQSCTTAQSIKLERAEEAWMQNLYWKTEWHEDCGWLRLAWKHRLDRILHHVFCSTEEDAVKKETEIQIERDWVRHCWRECELIFCINFTTVSNSLNNISTEE